MLKKFDYKSFCRFERLKRRHYLNDEWFDGNTSKKSIRTWWGQINSKSYSKIIALIEWVCELVVFKFDLFKCFLIFVEI